MNKMSKWQKYLSTEIGIEFKAGIYFYCILFFYALYELSIGRFYTSILIMAEMILTAYVICNIQVYLFQNFDESEHFALSELCSSIVCTILYTAVSYLGNWFDHNVLPTFLFFLYIIFCYICIFAVYKIKRTIDTKNLNQDLTTFKKRGVSNE